MKITTETLTKSLSIQDLAAIVHADASDTYSKYAEAFSNLSCLTLLEDIDNAAIRRSDEVKEIFDNLYEFILEECDNKISLIMNDGDILWLETYEDFDPLDPEHDIKYIRSVHKVYESEDHSQYYTEEQYLCHWSESGFVVDSTMIRELSNRYNWSYTEMITSLADSMNSSLLITRLTSLVEEGTVTISDINAAIENIPFAAGSTGLTLIESLKDLGTNLNSSTIMRLIQQTYKSMASTSPTATDDTIDWNEYDYSVAGYAGTIIKKAFVTAAQIVGSILLYAGAVVLKIAGAVIMAIGFVANALYQGVQYVANEFAKYNPLADTKEWPMPIWQITYPNISSSSYLAYNDYILDTSRDAIPYILSKLESETTKGFVTKLATPGINYYIWSNDEGQTYNVEAYLTTLFKGKPLNEYPPHLISSPYSLLFVPKFVCYNYSDANYHFNVEGEFGLFQESDTTHLFDDDEYLVSNSPVKLSQDDCKQSLLNSVYWLCHIALRQLLVKEISNDYGFVYSGITSAHLALDICTSNISACDITARYNSGTEYWEEKLFTPAYLEVNGRNNAYNNIVAFMTRVAPHGYLMQNEHYTSPTSRVTNPISNRATWSDMLNYVIPSIQYFGLDIAFMNALCSLMNDEYYDYEGDDVNFYRVYYSTWKFESDACARGAGMFIPSNFRNDYELVPPSQEPGTALKIILISAAITTALVIGVSVTRTVLKKTLRRTMAAKYSTIEKMHNDYVEGGCTDTNLLVSFQKAVKKYNLIARLVGYDSLSFVNGWESGDGSSAVEAVNGLPQGVQDIVQSVAAEAGITKENIIDSVHQSLALQTDDITGTEGPSELSLKDIRDLIVG